MTTVETYQHKLLLAKQMLIRSSHIEMGIREKESDNDSDKVDYNDGRSDDGRSDENNYEKREFVTKLSVNTENQKLIGENLRDVNNNKEFREIEDMENDKNDIKKEKMECDYGSKMAGEEKIEKEYLGGESEEDKEEEDNENDMPDLIMHSKMEQFRGQHHFMSPEGLEKFYKSFHGRASNPFNNFNNNMVASFNTEATNNTYETNNTLSNKAELFSRVGKMEFNDLGREDLEEEEMKGDSKSMELGGASRNIFCCHICSFVGSSEQDFNSHMSQHFEHQCPHCTYSSRTEGRLKRHIKDFHSSESEDPNSQHKPKVSSPKRTCRYCKFYTYDQVEFWLHLKKHIKPEKLLECPHCEFVTELKHHLEYHIRVHIGSKPYKCSKCNYSCVNKSMLNSHMKSHTNVYQFRCKDCNYATKYSHSLKLHLFKKNHQADVVLNSDGSLPTTAQQQHNNQLDTSKRGPPRGPRLMKRKMEEGFENKSNDALNNHNYFNYLYEKQRILAHPGPYNNQNAFPRSGSFEIPYLWRDSFKSRSPSELSSASKEEHFDGVYNYNLFGAPKRPASPNNLLQQLYNKPFVPAYVCRLCSERFTLPHLLKQHLEEVHLKEVKLFSNFNTNLNSNFNNNHFSNKLNNINFNNNFYLEKPKISPFNLVPTTVKKAETKEEAEDIEQRISKPNNNQECNLPNTSNDNNNYYQSNNRPECTDSLAEESKTIPLVAALDLSKKCDNSENSDSSPKFNDTLPKTEHAEVISSFSNRRRLRKGVAYKVNAASNEEEEEDDDEEEAIASSKLDELNFDTNKNSATSDSSPTVSDHSTTYEDPSNQYEVAKEGAARLKVDSNWHMCRHCEMAFADQLTHRLHMGYHGYHNAFQCNSCGQKCVDAFDFMLHLMCKAHN